MTKTDAGGKPQTNVAGEEGEQVAATCKKKQGQPASSAKAPASTINNNEEVVATGEKEEGQPAPSADAAASSMNDNKEGEEVVATGAKEEEGQPAPSANAAASSMNSNEEGEQAVATGEKEEGQPPPSANPAASSVNNKERDGVVGAKQEGKIAPGKVPTSRRDGEEWGRAEAPRGADASRDVSEFLKSASERQLRARGVEVQKEVQLREGAKLVISAGSVIDFGGGKDWPPEACAAVNAANRGGMGGGGVDGAFGTAGGEALLRDRRALPVLEGTYDDRIRTGSAVATGPNRYGRLHVGTVIHAVGPIYGEYSGFEEADRLLADAYEATMELAKRRGIQYLGVCLLSAGIFRGRRSLKDVLEVAVTAVARKAYRGLKEVHLVGFTHEEIDLLLEHARALENSDHRRTLDNKSHVDVSNECEAQSRPSEDGAPSTGHAEASPPLAAGQQDALEGGVALGKEEHEDSRAEGRPQRQEEEAQAESETEGRCFPRLCSCFYVRRSHIIRPAQMAGANGEP